jgi:hypothetical protein
MTLIEHEIKTLACGDDAIRSSIEIVIMQRLPSREAKAPSMQRAYQNPAHHSAAF